MPDTVAELLVGQTGLRKLGARNISLDEARQVPSNRHVVVRNPRAETPGRRRLLIGRSNGGRTLTLVIEHTVDPTTWLIVTGWDSSPRERRLLSH